MFLRNSSKVHPELDCEFVRRLFADEEETLLAEQVTSPWDLYAVETLRDQHQLRIGEAFPADLFVFGKGEPENPACTKVGGRPFWPAGEPWPTLPDGSPGFFLAQLNFADSADLVGEVIADAVLVIVANSHDEWLSDPNSLSFHWVAREIAEIAELDVPSAIGNAGPFYGALYRSPDYPGAIDAAYELKLANGYNLPIINGTKIGGLPHFIQRGIATDKFFLGQLTSIQAEPDVIFPWVNQREKLTLGFDENGIYHKKNCAVFYDMGSIYLFADEEGEVTWHFECY